VQNHVLVYAEAVDVAAEGAVWYARRISDGPFEALHVPGSNTDTGINARWFDLTGGEPKLDIRPPGTDATRAVLDAIAELRQGPEDVVTVVLPEQFKKRSLMAAAQRAQFRLKLRLLTEPGVIVADVPAVTSERRPEGKVPLTLQVRVLADKVDDATTRAVEYAGTLNEADLRIVHFGEPDDLAGALGLPVDSEPQPGRLGDAVLGYVRRLTDDPTTSVNVILPERLHENLPRLRGRRALAVKRCLLFEPHVILSSVPSQAAA
jgi:hypothetical protein